MAFENLLHMLGLSESNGDYEEKPNDIKLDICFNVQLNIVSDSIFNEFINDNPLAEALYENTNFFIITKELSKNLNLKNCDVVGSRLMGKIDDENVASFSYLIVNVAQPLHFINVILSLEMTCCFKDEHINSDKEHCGLEEEFSTNNKPTIIIFESHWFNIKNKSNFLNYSKLQDLRLELTREASLHKDTRGRWVLPSVERFSISAVKGQDACPEQDKDLILKGFFSSNKWLSLNDVFSIDVEDSQISEDSVGRDVTSPRKQLFFKVVQMHPRHFGVANLRQSVLFEASKVNSFIPPSTYLSSAYPPHQVIEAFGDVCEDLCRIMHAFLSNQVKLREYISPSILVSFPSSSSSSSSSFSKIDLLLEAISQRFSLHYYQVDCMALDDPTSTSLRNKLLNLFETVSDLAPCLLLLQDVGALGKDLEGGEDRATTSTLSKQLNALATSPLPIITIATTTDLSSLSYHVQKCFFKQYSFEYSNAGMREGLLGLFLGGQPVHDLHKLALSTAGLRPCQLEQLSFMAMEKTSREEMSGLSMEDFEELVKQIQKMSGGVVSKIPQVSWQQVGGLDDVIRDVIDTIQLPLKHPHLFNAALRRSGILFFGPPGTGKTLLAKAIATECSLNFMSVKGPELLNMYVGQTEENIRKVFQTAHEHQPSVIFFDELDSLCPNRGNSGDSGGVMDRVVSQLLAEMDSLGGKGVFVVGATNRPDLLDPSMLRPGRFDKLVYVGVDGRMQTRLNILKALTLKTKMSKDVDLEWVASSTSEMMTGADLSSLLNSATLSCIRRKLTERGLINDSNEVISQSEESLKDVELILEPRDFQEAINNTKPSLSIQELSRYEELKKQFIVEKDNGY